MSGIGKLALALAMLIAMQEFAGAEENKYNEARGQLLYTTHCIACHTTQIHWRDKKLVTDWESLLNQVRRWQYISGYSWSEEEIRDVSNHLNLLFYGYKNKISHKNKSHLMYKE